MTNPTNTGVELKGCPEANILALADKAVAWALDALSGYSCEECDAGIHYAQARGFDRWSMQAQIDHPECFGCEGTAFTAEGEPCPICQPETFPPSPREKELEAALEYIAAPGPDGRVKLAYDMQRTAAQSLNRTRPIDGEEK